MYSYGPPHMAGQKQDDQHEYTSSSYVRIRNVALKTCQRRWTIGKRGERGSGISMLVAQHGDDDDIYNTSLVLKKDPFLVMSHSRTLCQKQTRSNWKKGPSLEVMMYGLLKAIIRFYTYHRIYIYIYIYIYIITMYDYHYLIWWVCGRLNVV